MKRALIATADLQQRELQKKFFGFRAAFITLTYRPGLEWEPKHISECLKRFRHWCARRGWVLPYEWKAELQKRGAVHFHLIVWLPASLSSRLLKLDEKRWWPYGFANFQWARKRDGAVRYLAKYLAKAESQSMPKGIRLHGRGGLDKECRRQVRYRLLPSYVQEKFENSADVHRAEGGGWVDKLTGEWHRAAFKLEIDWGK